MKQVKSLFIGFLLTIVGICMFLQSLTFNDPSNNGILGDIMGSLFGNTSPKAISGALFVVVFLFILMFAFSPSMITFLGLMVSIILAFLVVIGSMDVTIADMSGLKVGIIAVCIMAGIGMMGGSIVKLSTDKNQY